MSDEYDYLFKCICVGDGGCGKTALVVRFSQGFFQEQYKLTIGVEFAVKTIELVNKKKVKLQIWDTGGQERFQYVRPLYYRGSMGAILLFDLTNRESYDHLPKWIEEVKANAGEIPMLLVGNKSDLTNDRQVPRTEAEAFAKEFQMYYVESSAKDGTGVGDVFALLSCLMIGIEVPDQYLVGTTVMDAKGNVLGSAAKAAQAVSKPAAQPVAQPVAPVKAAAPVFVKAPEPEPEPLDASSFDEIPSQSQLSSIPVPGGQSSAGGFFSSAIKMDSKPAAVEPQKLTTIPQPQFKAQPMQPVQHVAPKVESEEWDIPDMPQPKAVANEAPSFAAKSVPSEDEIIASIPAIPKKPAVQQSSMSGPITFEEMEEDLAPIAPAGKQAAPPPLVFEKPEELDASALESDEDFQQIPVLPQPNVQQPIQQAPQKPAVVNAFPQAKPAAPPPGFKPKVVTNVQQSSSQQLTAQPQAPQQKPQQASSIPFSGGMQQPGFKEQNTGAMNSLLGALGTKGGAAPAAQPKGFMGFSAGGQSSAQKPGFFAPTAQPQQKSTAPAGNVGFSKPQEMILPKPEMKIATVEEKKDKKTLKEEEKRRKEEEKRREREEKEEEKRRKKEEKEKPKEDKKKDKEEEKEDKKDKGSKKEKNIVICPNCGAMLSSAYKFCNKCGSKI